MYLNTKLYFIIAFPNIMDNTETTTKMMILQFSEER